MRTDLFLEESLDAGVSMPLAGGEAVVFTAPAPDRKGPNEDAAALLDLGRGRGVLLVADGFGGMPAGEKAARLSIESVASAVEKGAGDGGEIRAGILDGFDRANRAVRALPGGAAATLLVAEVQSGTVRTCHVGDSGALLVGGGGRLKLVTVAHSPVGYAVESGLLDDAEAMHHEDRHLVSNMIGADDMRIEVGSAMPMRPRDTLVLASDGLLDNLHTDEIVRLVRKGPLIAAADALVAAARTRMTSPAEGDPSKPDDLTVVLYRGVKSSKYKLRNARIGSAS